VRILLAGASGFLGPHLARHLRARGDRVRRLVRRPSREPDELTWSPQRRELPADALTGIDAVINLAGAGIGERRWNEQYRTLIRASRVDSTATLAAAIAARPGPPPALLNASAIGYYGDTGDTPVDEDSPPGEGFMARVCQAWEAATGPAAAAGARVALLRSGLPLHPDGGLLKPLLLPTRLGLGGRLGDGRQYIPWISLPDWLAAVTWLLDGRETGAADPTRVKPVSGPVNLVGPDPVTNADLVRALARGLHRPAVLPVPGFALRVLVGGLADEEILVSHRVLPTVLIKSGFAFRHPTVDSALQVALAR